MRWTRLAWCVVVLGMPAFAACGATGQGIQFGSADPPPTVRPPEPSKASAQEVGVLTLLADALSNLDLDEAQHKRVVALTDEIKRRHRGALGNRTMLAVDMAEAVESGTVDEAKLLATADALGHARAEVGSGDGKALEELHGLLKPDQRAKLAAALSTKADQLKLDDFESRYGIWRLEVRIPPEQDARIEPKLKADAASAESAKAERDAWQKRVRATAAAFKEATFSGALLMDPDPIGTTVGRMKRTVAFLKIVVPELTEDQRARAATFIRAEAGVSVKPREE